MHVHPTLRFLCFTRGNWTSGGPGFDSHNNSRISNQHQIIRSQHKIVRVATSKGSEIEKNAQQTGSYVQGDQIKTSSKFYSGNIVLSRGGQIKNTQEILLRQHGPLYRVGKNKKLNSHNMILYTG